MRTVMLLTTLLVLAGCESRPPFDPVAYNMSVDADNRPELVQRFAMAMMQRRGSQPAETASPYYLRRQ
jgi:hypothetical protein